MIKRIISCLLIASMLFSVAGVVASAAEKENYGYLNAKIIETNKKTAVDVMTIGENIYVNAKFYEQFGFIVEINDGVVIIGNNSDDNIPKGAMGFYFNNAQCRRINNAIAEEYEAPFKSVKNTKGAWIPFEYSLTMLNGSVLTDKKGDVYISSPKQGLLDVLNGIAVNQQSFIFDYAKDFGYGKGSQTFLNTASHFVNVFNGLLTFDGASWSTFVMSSSLVGSVLGDLGYDQKYGANVARMMCTNSDEELMDAVDSISTINDFISEDGALADILSDLRKSNETEIGELYKESQEILKNIKKTNGDVSEYNRVYSKLENAMKKSDFLELGDVVSDFQKANKNLSKGLTLVAAVAETVSYYNEFTNRDLFAVSSLELLIGELPNIKGEVSLTTKGALLSGAKAFRTDAASYTMGRFFKENIDDFLSEGINLCTSANIALLAWNLISSLIPFISDSLSATDKYELSIYAMCLQAEANRVYNEKLTAALSSEGNITEETLKELSMYAYSYLKICYVTRNAAIAGKSPSLSKKGEEATEIVKGKQKGINKQIVPFLNIAKTSVNADAYACLGLSEAVLDVDGVNIVDEKGGSRNEDVTKEPSTITTEPTTEVPGNKVGTEIPLPKGTDVKAYLNKLEDMLESNPYVWLSDGEKYLATEGAFGECKEFVFNKLSVDTVASEYVIDYCGSQALYGVFFNDAQYLQNKDPEGRYINCYELDANNFTWLMKYVFDKCPDLSAKYKTFYYYEDKVYLSIGELGGGPGCFYTIENYKLISGNKYNLKITWEVENITQKGSLNLVAELKNDSVQGVYWKLYSYKAMSLNNATSSTAMKNIPSDAFEYNGHYYKVFSDVCDSWEDAKTYCENLGGHLAVISSQEENDALYQYLVDCGLNTAYFGCSDFETEGKWKWVTSEENSYFNWHSGEPNAESGEDYAEFYWKYSDGTWNDGNFGNGTQSDAKNFICEWE